MHILSKNDIDIILKNNDLSDKQDIKDILATFEGKTFVDIIKQDSVLINYIPEELLKMYLSLDMLPFLSHAYVRMTFTNAVVASVFLKKFGIPSTLSSEEDLNYIIETVNNPQELFYRCPKYFSCERILNYSRVPLPEDFILKNVKQDITLNSNFFKYQHITLKVLKKAFAYHRASEVYSLESLMYSAFSECKIDFTREAFDYAVKNNVMPSNIPLNYFKLNKSQVRKMLSRFKKEKCTQSIKNIMLTQEIPILYMYLYIPRNLFHIYLAHNPYVTDEIILKFIKFDKFDKKINWEYVNYNIPIHKHIEYMKLLIEEGKEDIIKMNIEKSLDRNEHIDNLKDLLELNIDLSSIQERILGQLNLEIADI